MTLLMTRRNTKTEIQKERRAVSHRWMFRTNNYEATRHDTTGYDTIPYYFFQYYYSFGTISYFNPTIVFFSLRVFYMFFLPILVVGIAFFPVVFKLIVEEVYDNRCWRRRSKRLWRISFAFISFLILFLAVVVRR